MSEGITAEKGKVTTVDGVSVMTVGTHSDTMDTVETVFRAQRKLSFTYGAIFFGVTLFIPFGSVYIEWWYGTPIWGGFTPNYLFVSLLYYVFLWAMAWTYSVQADKLDNKMNALADEAEAKFKARKAGEAS